ncbi:MAG: PEP-CTERM sorting domain-containing protein, partial [Verrucomicrobia bacterium]|nr:PEP-CTERM sorting domain-containing protein [Verrucomicrobiota bacterium]
SANAQVIYTQDFQSGPRTGPGTDGTGSQSLAPYGYSTSGNANTAIEATAGNYYGKVWNGYNNPNQESSANVQFGADAWGGGSLLSSYGLLAGNTVNYSIDTRIADAVSAGGTLGLTIRFFNSNFSQYYEGSSVFLSIAGESRENWTTHTLSAVIPVEAQIIQFGIFSATSNWSAGSAFIDNVQISTASVPEPSVASLLGFGVLGLAATRFRRRS